MTDPTIRSVELDAFTQKFIWIWYEFLKKPLFFDSIDEFLLTVVRRYTVQYIDSVPPGVRSEFGKLYEDKLD